jgi:hypothetical protein
MSLSFVLRRLRYAAPQWEKHITATIQRASRTSASMASTGVGLRTSFWD